MSLAHDRRVLELDSQVELLERVQLLTNFGSNLVTITGESGAGKSWVAHRYLEAWSEDTNQSLLICHPSQNDEQRRSMLITQLIPSPLFNPQDTLVDSFTRLLENEHCNLVIVIDDAHFLSEPFISELWALIQEAQLMPKWTINAVLFSGAKSIERLLARLSHGIDHKPVDIEIEPLNQSEADRFFEQLVIRFVEDNMERRVRNAYRKLNSLLPGEIMRLGEQKVSKKIIIRSIVGSPKNIALLAVTLLVLLGVGYWWLLGQSGTSPDSSPATVKTEQTAIPTLSGSATHSDPSNPSDSTGQTGQGGATKLVDDSAALPPPVVTTTTSVGGVSKDKNRVVISSAVVDKLMKDEVKPSSVKPNLQNEAATAQDLSAPASSSKPKAIPAKVSPTEKNASTTPSDNAQSDADKATSPEKLAFALSNSQLSAFSPRSYTLQLAAMNTAPEVNQFIDEYKIAHKVFVYKTTRSGKQWFIITYHNYPTIQLARDAVVTLPKALQKVGPWAKSLSQVQREMNSVN
ncbi:AAA family ATPase [Vibrio profundum]|uniref:AAA family ATPase n=1 Tax=Vibrio profundum TaxID=2910247 RepID=UPI003D0EFFF5